MIIAVLIVDWRPKRDTSIREIKDMQDVQAKVTVELNSLSHSVIASSNRYEFTISFKFDSYQSIRANKILLNFQNVTWEIANSFCSSSTIQNVTFDSRGQAQQPARGLYPDDIYKLGVQTIYGLLWSEAFKMPKADVTISLLPAILHLGDFPELHVISNQPPEPPASHKEGSQT